MCDFDYAKIQSAAITLCRFCGSKQCENCMIRKLEENAYEKVSKEDKEEKKWRG